MEPAKGTELAKLQQMLQQAGLGRDLNLLSAVLFARNLVCHLSIYGEADKSRIQQFVLREISKRNPEHEAFPVIIKALESFLLRTNRVAELEDHLAREKSSMEALVDEMSSFFISMRASRDRQEQSLFQFNEATTQAVKAAPTRKDILKQVRGLLTEFVTEFREEARQWEERAKTLERTANFDGLLTDLYNRRSLDAFLAENVVTSHSRHTPFSMCMIDVDHFKSVNDTYGHQVGDDVLRALAKIVKSYAATHDGYAARYGGEELVLALPLPLEKAATVAEEMRRDVEEYEFQSRQGGKIVGDIIHFTVSIGVAEVLSDWDASRLVEAADKALYLAKGSGRNLVARHSDAASGRVGWI
ncbi:MAG: GGDEF domain-containing protein [Desulfovibrio sp.]